jgi:AI-2 transport protein TqsA
MCPKGDISRRSSVAWNDRCTSYIEGFAMSEMERDQADRRVRTVCLLILAVVALGAALNFLKPVLVPFLLALFFTYCLTPVIDYQVNSLRLPRVVAILGAALLGFLILALCGVILAASAAEIAENFGVYQAYFREFIERTSQPIKLDRIGIHADPGRYLTVPDDAIRDIVSSAFVQVRDVVTGGTLVVVFMVFMLVGRRSDHLQPAGLLDDIEQSVRRYTLLMVALSALTGFLVWLPLWLLGVQFAFLFGFLAFLLNFIPNVGSIVATLLPVPVILLSQDLSITAKVLALVLPAAIQIGLATLVQPKALGRSLHLHPVVVLMALIFFGMIWGVSGAFLAAPIAAVIKIILERIPTTKPLAALLAGDLAVFSRPASASRKPPEVGGTP